MQKQEINGAFTNLCFFDAKKYPEITFLSSSVTKQDKGFMINGTLNMHGVDKAVSFLIKGSSPVTDPWGKIRRSVRGEITVNRQDFDIKWNKVLDSGGVLVGNNILVRFELEFIKKEEAKKDKEK